MSITPTPPFPPTPLSIPVDHPQTAYDQVHYDPLSPQGRMMGRGEDGIIELTAHVVPSKYPSSDPRMLYPTAKTLTKPKWTGEDRARKELAKLKHKGLRDLMEDMRAGDYYSEQEVRDRERMGKMMDREKERKDRVAEGWRIRDMERARKERARNGGVRATSARRAEEGVDRMIDEEVKRANIASRLRDLSKDRHNAALAKHHKIQLRYNQIQDMRREKEREIEEKEIDRDIKEALVERNKIQYQLQIQSKRIVRLQTAEARREDHEIKRKIEQEQKRLEYVKKAEEAKAAKKERERLEADNRKRAAEALRAKRQDIGLQKQGADNFIEKQKGEYFKRIEETEQAMEQKKQMDKQRAQTMAENAKKKQEEVRLARIEEEERLKNERYMSMQRNKYREAEKEKAKQMRIEQEKVKVELEKLKIQDTLERAKKIEAIQKAKSNQLELKNVEKNEKTKDMIKMRNERIPKPGPPKIKGKVPKPSKEEKIDVELVETKAEEDQAPAIDLGEDTYMNSAPKQIVLNNTNPTPSPAPQQPTVVVEDEFGGFEDPDDHSQPSLTHTPEPLPPQPQPQSQPLSLLQAKQSVKLRDALLSALEDEKIREAERQTRIIDIRKKSKDEEEVRKAEEEIKIEREAARQRIQSLMAEIEECDKGTKK